MPLTSRHTGETISQRAYDLQSIDEVLTTPIGSRVGLRDFGSNLHLLVDKPVGAGLVVDVAQASFGALKRWLPRFKLVRVILEDAFDGGMAFGLEVEDALGDRFVVGVAI